MDIAVCSGMLTKILAGALSLLLMGYSLPRMVNADGGVVSLANEMDPEMGTAKEASEYAQLEKASPGLEDFIGGRSAAVEFGAWFLLGLILYVPFYLIAETISYFFTGEWRLPGQPGK